MRLQYQIQLMKRMAHTGEELWMEVALFNGVPRHTYVLI